MPDSKDSRQYCTGTIKCKYCFAQLVHLRENVTDMLSSFEINFESNSVWKKFFSRKKYQDFILFYFWCMTLLSTIGFYGDIFKLFLLLFPCIYYLFLIFELLCLNKKCNLWFHIWHNFFRCNIYQKKHSRIWSECFETLDLLLPKTKVWNRLLFDHILFLKLQTFSFCLTQL